MWPSPRSPAPYASSKASLAAICSAASGRNAQLTELGQRMLPLLKQCYDSALSARSLASAIKSGEVGSLRLALSQTIDPSLVMPHVVELGKLFQRPGAEALSRQQRRGARLPQARRRRARPWRRSRRGMGAPRFLAAVHRGLPDRGQFNAPACHCRGRSRSTISSTSASCVRTYCESTPMLLEFLRAQDIDVERRHETGAESDLIALLEAGVGVALPAAQHQGARHAAAPHGGEARAQPHRLSLWRRRPPAHRRRLHPDEDAARLRLVALRHARRPERDDAETRDHRRR